ncbi:DUF6252 family protein [Pedobacter sp. P351]|uniref:DUF6252 family protein n=1 Tax=Pedobacter superstes TaxID=3133441 RepID=UPI0030B1D14E
MKQIIFLIIATSVVLNIQGCKKDDKPSQIGADIMTAKIDGIEWKAQHCWSCVEGGKGLRTVYLPEEGKFNVLGQMVKNDINITMTIDMSGVKDVGTYELGANTGSQNYAKVFNDKLDRLYYTTNPASGSVTITKLSISEKIISGTFELTASDLSSNGINVTHGVFDLKF